MSGTDSFSLSGLLKTEMARVDALIAERMECDVDLIPEIARHLIGSGGKRLRPMLTIAAARLCGHDNAGEIELAACVELMHSATLLHDDVVDDARLRRARPAARTLWGNPASVLVGDFMLGRAFELMVGTQNLRALDILSRAASVIASGEVMQLAAIGRIGTKDACLRVIDAKTATLFAAAAQMGGVLAPATDKDADTKSAALSAFGHHLGMAFQLSDDVLDYQGGEVFGKDSCADLREGKATLPIILSHETADTSERTFWERIIKENGTDAPDDMAEARAFLEKSGALTKTMDIAETYAENARAALDIFPKGAWLDALIETTRFSITRVS